MRGMLSFTHIPVAARAAHRVINVIVFIIHLSFFCVTLTNLFTFSLKYPSCLLLSCFPRGLLSLLTTSCVLKTVQRYDEKRVGVSLPTRFRPKKAFLLT